MFLTSLVVRESEEGGQWCLHEPLEYEAGWQVFKVPAGFDTDFASVPRPLWNIFPPYGRHTKAAVVHDWLYRTRAVNRRDADGIFRRIMKEFGVSLPRRWVFWSAVRMFGGRAWRSAARRS